jgi:hypothetical protein
MMFAGPPPRAKLGWPDMAIAVAIVASVKMDFSGLFIRPAVPRVATRAYPLIVTGGVVVSLLHVAVRNPGVHEFLPVSLVSQTRIELPCMRLGVQEEIVDVF